MKISKTEWFGLITEIASVLVFLLLLFVLAFIGTR